MLPEKQKSGMRTRIAHVSFWFMLLGSLVAMGQEPDSVHAGGNDPNLPQPTSKAEALSRTEQLSSQDSEAVKKREFTTPDLPPKWARVPSYRGKYFSTTLGFVALADYNAFSQDSDSITQVGRQRDQWDDRSTASSSSGLSGLSHTRCITMRPTLGMALMLTKIT
jgi:hypothetical protein